MTMTDDVLGLGWVPAPGAGSAARRTWPRTGRLAWWLARRPLLPLALAGLVALGVVSGPVTAVVAVIVVVAGLSVWQRPSRVRSTRPRGGCCGGRGARRGPTGCGGGPR